MSKSTDYSKMCNVALLVDRDGAGRKVDTYIYERSQLKSDDVLAEEAKCIFIDMKKVKRIIRDDATLTAVGIARSQEQFLEMNL